MSTYGATALAVLLTLALAGCPAGKIREEGENGGRCFADNTCNPGMTCVSGWCLVWPEAGVKTGDGGCPRCKDASPCRDAGTCPTQPDGGCADAGQCPTCPDSSVADAAPCPTCPDASPCADGGNCPKCPKVLLKTPATGASSVGLNQEFTFTVTGGNPITSCKLLINGKVTQTIKSPGPKATFTQNNVPDGSLSWDVSCEDSKGNIGFSAEGRTFVSAPVSLFGCKASGFLSNTKYQLAMDISAGPGDCFVIGASQVALNGNNKIIRAAKTKDILYHRSDQEPFTVLRNNLTPTGGSFSTGWKSPYSNRKNLHGNAADLDGDGDIDLTTTEYNGMWRIYPNNGAGSFGGSSAYAIGGGMGYDASRILDFDLDGNLDLFLAHDGGNEVYLRGNGSTSAFVQGYSADMGLYTHNLDLGDFDGDRKVDVVTGSSYYGGSNDLRHLRLNRLTAGTGGSFASGWLSSSSDARGSGPALVADFNGDNSWDMVLPRVVSSNTRRTFVRLNNGKGTSFYLSLQVSNALPVAAVDIDGDDDTDLVLQAYSGTKPAGVLIYRNNGGGTFTLITNTGLPTSGRAVIGVADLDGDGDVDLALVESDVFTKPLTIHANSGKGAFAQVWASSETGLFSHLHVRDFDSDGDADMFVSLSQSKSKHRMMYYRNNGVGSFASAWAMATSGSQSYATSNLGDLDGAKGTGVRITGTNVRLKNIAAIRGFSYGVDVKGNASEITSVVVDDPDIYGVRYSGVTSGKLQGVTVKNLHQGTALGVVSASNLTINNSKFCDSGRRPRVVNLSAYCYKASGLSGSNNRMRLINGCLGLGWKSCK